MEKTLILQCPGIVCSPPVVSKCLGEAHRRLELFTLHYITLHYITLHYIRLNPFFSSILLVICFFSMDGPDSRFINLVVEELRHKTHLLLATSACS